MPGRARGAVRANRCAADVLPRRRPRHRLQHAGRASSGQHRLPARPRTTGPHALRGLFAAVGQPSRVSDRIKSAPSNRSLTRLGSPGGYRDAGGRIAATTHHSPLTTMYPHHIRLRGPWECEPLIRAVRRPDGAVQTLSGPVPPARRVRMPCHWLTGDLADFTGRVRFRRRFGYPGQIDAHARVWPTWLATPPL